MTRTTFFRLLKTPIDDKGEALAARIAVVNAGDQAEETFTLDPADFSLISGSPLAYWVSSGMLHCFAANQPLGSSLTARLGVNTTDDFRFVRLFFEVSPESTQTAWVPLAKGGGFEKFYGSFHLCIDWENQGQRLKAYIQSRGDSPSRNVRSESLYGNAGLTYSSRTQKGLGFKALPSGMLFTVKGPIITTQNTAELSCWLGVLNSIAFQFLVRCQMAFGSYEVGVIQRTPLPSLPQHETHTTLAALAREAHDLQRDRDRSDETTHAFCLPGLVLKMGGSLLEASLALEAEAQAAQGRLAAIQVEIDALVFDLYGLSEADRALVRAEMGVGHGGTEDTENDKKDLGDLGASVADSDDDEEPTPPEDLPARVQNLLMWCVGVALSRWDVRLALDPTLLPPLQGPFDPLPRCAPGALVGTDGLPPTRPEEIAPEAWLRARKDVSHRGTEGTEKGKECLGDLGASVASSYPLPIAWDGILVDDPTHPSDIVTRVRGVLSLLWGDRAGAIEREACEILGYRTLRDYFRDPRKGFFAFHVKRYSKSRRKAPIYWLLQSEKRNYAIWLYYHRLDKATLYAAGRDYADAKVALEEARLQELRQGLEALGGSARKHREGEIEGQQKLVAEVTDFRKRLDGVALLNLPPDLNDGVVISIAPLRELVPWKEAQKTWEKLVAGEYPWSTMSKQMRERGLVE